MPTPRWPTAALLLIVCSTACSSPTPPAPPPVIVTKIERVEIKHPIGLLLCLAEPGEPPRPRTVKQGADWIGGLRAAGADCRWALACIRVRQDGGDCDEKDRPPTSP